MTGDARWLRIKTLFTQCEPLSARERDAFLAGECGDDPDLLHEVSTLLAAEGKSQALLDGDAFSAIHEMSAADPVEDRIGEHVGPYRLLKIIGEGGMGSVYLAERDDGDFQRTSALKLVRGDFISGDARTRFLRERKILAQLNHPHIALLHDAGVTRDGTPYFTLEFVEGEKITDYCDRRHLSVRHRMQLILQVCDAVSYAHRNLIVHRDLKPSNILVTSDGDVKLLDFGIAKLLDKESHGGDTASHARMMTPTYAAPEQILGEAITTATDVYAIGVLLYELLSGRLPYASADAGALGWSKAVIEELPEAASRAVVRAKSRSDQLSADEVAAARGVSVKTLRHQLRGDIERILQRALAKPADARYVSVGSLAADVRAYLDGRAISGGTRIHQWQKFARRNWLRLAVASALLLIVIASASIIVWQARETAREAQNALHVKDFLYGLFTAFDPHESKGRDVSTHELLDRGAQRIELDKTLDAGQKAEIESILGRIYWQLGLFDQANTLQANALGTLSHTDIGDARFIRAEAERADTLTDLGDLKGAQNLIGDARHRIDASSNSTVPDQILILHAQGRVALSSRDFPAFKGFADRELALARQVPGVNSELLYHALMAAGAASWGLAKTGDAEVLWREAVATASQQAGADDLDVAMAQSNIAIALQSESHYADAKELEEKALATEQRVLGNTHPLVLGVRRDLGLSNYRLGYLNEARVMMESVIDMQRKKMGADHPVVAGAEINLGYLLSDAGDQDKAEHVLDDSATIFQTKYGREFQGTRMALRTLAMTHGRQGKLDQAERELLEVKAQEDKLGLRELEGDETSELLSDVKRRSGNADEAVGLARDALAIALKRSGAGSRYAADAHQCLARALRDAGDAQGAIAEFRASLDSRASFISGAQDLSGAITRRELAMVLAARDADRSEAMKLLAESADLRERFLGKNDPVVSQTRELLATLNK